MSREIKIPTESTLELMIREEEKIRMSKEYQNECTKVKNIPNGWLEVSKKIQKDVVKKFGYESTIDCDIACNMLRRARYLYPNNQIFKTVPVYVRENKANIGSLNINDKYPDIALFNTMNKEINMSDIIDNNKINIVLGSSST